MVQYILWNPMSSIDDIGFSKELLQNPARIRPSDEFLFGFERISSYTKSIILLLCIYYYYLYVSNKIQKKFDKSLSVVGC